jgi:serine/threonine protein kinase
VKVIAGHLAEDQNALARFTREAEIISQLHHPHVVQVLDFNTTEDGRPYLVMELLKGLSLDAVMARSGQLELNSAARIAIQAASALSAAHQAGIVHRDLKPANIFLVDTGEELFVKLLDFGISKRAGEEIHSGGRKLTGEFDILGTPEYMAPEQALGKTAAVDARGDQYALAVILYEMLTGRVPFTADDVMDLLQRVIRDIPLSPSVLRPDLPLAIDEVILRAMSKSPEDRFPQISDFANALELAAGFVAVSIPPRPMSVPPGAVRERSPIAPPVFQTPEFRRSTSTIPPSSGDRGDGRSWHARDPVHAVQGLVDRGRQELGLDNLELAVSCAESALEIAQSLRNDEVNNIISKNARLFQQIFERRLGKLTRTITVSTRPSKDEKLSPEQAFLLSRLEGGLSVEEAIDLSPLSREQTLGQLVMLMRQGHIRLGA